jgi:hypothetical protein
MDFDQTLYIHSPNLGESGTLLNFKVKGQGVKFLQHSILVNYNFFVFPDKSVIFDMLVHDYKVVCRVP